MLSYVEEEENEESGGGQQSSGEVVLDEGMLSMQQGIEGKGMDPLLHCILTLTISTQTCRPQCSEAEDEIIPEGREGGRDIVIRLPMG